MATRRREKRVTGIGGIFFRAEDPEGLAGWYRRHLGIRVEGAAAVFAWRGGKDPRRKGHTIWSVFPAGSGYLGEDDARFMINYRVRDLDGLLAALRKEGVRVDPQVEDTPHGRFGWATDPEGNRVELWEPPRVYRAPEDETPME